MKSSVWEKEYGVPLPEYEKAAARFHEQGLK